MARLNDPPPAAESVDALKRRFVRQNRELARINSNQSVRIRNLENEISRLLSENIAFRERVIRLQHEVDRSPEQAAFDNVGALRCQLEVKVAELSSVVKELGKVQIEPRRMSRRKSLQQSSPKRSPDQRNWKNALTLSEVTGATDGRLPPIAEDKYYPRRTLESDELRDILHSANALDSPDLGPPPVASWEEGDPTKNDADQNSPIQQWGTESTESVPMPSLANLETRKKRRESTHRAEAKISKPDSLQRSQHVPHKESVTQPLKAGAKRKFNVRDDDGDIEARRPPENNDFPFSRTAEIKAKAKDQITDAVSDRLASLEISQNNAAKVAENSAIAKQSVSIPSQKPRKALGAKSVNTDPLQSPAKVNRAYAGDKILDSKVSVDSKPRDRDRSSERLPSRKRGRLPKEPGLCKHPASNVDIVAVQPETPAQPVLDLFSPQSSEPSVARPDSRDTPPPPELDPKASVTDAFATAGRASRRARDSVSYAEPSLRDKMRRPTKELVDAVGADERPQIVKVNEVKAVPGFEKSQMRTIVIKKESSEEPADWRNLPIANGRDTHHFSSRVEPVSPLGKKGSGLSTKDLPATVITERRGRESLAPRKDLQYEQGKPVPTSGSTIAALVAGTQKARNRDTESTDKDARESKDIFELNSSSPADVVAVTTTAPARTSRRHSSISTNLDMKANAAGANIAVDRRRERRKESVVNATIRKDESEAGMKIMRSVDGMTESGVGRAERGASRRRSMML